MLEPATKSIGTLASRALQMPARWRLRAVCTNARPITRRPFQVSNQISGNAKDSSTFTSASPSEVQHRQRRPRATVEARTVSLAALPLYEIQSSKGYRCLLFRRDQPGGACLTEQFRRALRNAATMTTALPLRRSEAEIRIRLRSCTKPGRREGQQRQATREEFPCLPPPRTGQSTHRQRAFLDEQPRERSTRCPTAPCRDFVQPAERPRGSVEGRLRRRWEAAIIPSWE
jgi:hypothetical protein